MMSSPEVESLSAALAKAQGEIGHASKSAANPHFNSRYADLASIWDACRQPLAANGLAVAQTMRISEGAHVLVTTLLHASGQWLCSEMPILTIKDGPQAFGSGLTYARRYSLAAIVGVSQDDDDAETSAGRGDYEQGAGRAQRPATASAAPRSTPAAAPAADPAHAALAAQFKVACADIKELAGFGPLCEAIDAAKLPPAQLHDVHAEVAVFGLRFAADAEDLDFWVEKLRGWALPDRSEPYTRAAEAFDAAESRIERDAISAPEAAA